MLSPRRYLFSFGFILIIFFCFSNCAQLATGVAAKAVTVSQQEERSLGEYVDDTLIKAIIKNAYFDNNDKIFFNVDVEVSLGRVLLTGTVENMNLKIEATRIAWGVKGVKSVINEIQVTNSDNILNFADDLVISTKVLGKLMINEEVNSLNYNVETVNKVVYIIGIAVSKDEQNKVIEIANEVFGVEEVIDYIIVKSSNE